MDMNDTFLAPAAQAATAGVLDEVDRRLAAAAARGLPLVARPYAVLGAPLGLSEDEVIRRLARLERLGVVKRFGVIVRHHELGFRANAMVVWDVPDAEVAALGRCLASFDFVTLCYRRERRPPVWPYNLYCMIHGRSREAVLAHLEWMINRCGLQHLPHEVLFSRRRFKQCGAQYERPLGPAGGPIEPDRPSPDSRAQRA
jgi:DNA-binding Lrp family transcriptional regulator